MSNKKLTIVHVEDNFNPTAGYQINELLIQNQCFKDNVILISTFDMKPFHKKYNAEADQLFEKNNNVKIIRKRYCLKISSRYLYWNLFRSIEKLSPDIVYLHGVGDFKDLILWRKKRKYIIVRDSHMSWVASKNKFAKLFYTVFKKLFSPNINKKNKYETLFALGVEEKEYLNALGVSNNKIRMLPHGYNKNTMFFSENQRSIMRHELGISSEKIVISYIGKFNFAKKPDIIFDIVEKLDEATKSKIILNFVGPKDFNYMKFFNQKHNSFSSVKVLIQDASPFSELYKHYSMSDICIFPKETTLSSIHAQVCGCEVIMEKHNSNRERVVNNENLFPIDNIEAASKILKNVINSRAFDNRERYLTSLEYREYSNQVKEIRSLVK